MDMEDFQEKMDVNHRSYFIRMLKLKVLPECVLEQYLKVKMMIDRIDGHLTVADLALIVLMAGYDPRTKEFTETAEVEQLDEVADKEVEKIIESPTLSETPVVDGEQATADVPKTDESKPDLPANLPVEQPDEGKAMLWAHGMPVQLLEADELKQGKIVGILHPVAGSDKPTQLTVEYLGGKTVTVDEDEVEAI